MLSRLSAFLVVAAAMASTLPGQTQIAFPSEDSLLCSADLYLAKQEKTTAFIVLFHQGGASRGEYREIAPRLNELGFNCMAVDARAGSQSRGIQNVTASVAQTAGKKMAYLDALPDLLAALRHARKNFAQGKLLAWGSSYSAALVLHLAGEHPELVDGVLAFSPDKGLLESERWITDSARKIKELPVFITSGPTEGRDWKGLYDAIPSLRKVFYLPTEYASLHGSSVLWNNLGSADLVIQNPLAPGYWQAVETFLEQNFPQAAASKQLGRFGSTPA